MSHLKSHFSNSSHRAIPCQGGFTLIELMISLVLGIVVIAAMLVMYTTGAAATRYATAQGQMNEDAQMALSVITQELRRSGYNPQRPTGATTTAVNDLVQGGWGLRACANGFTDNTTLLVSGLACNAAAVAGVGAGLAVVHEGDLVSGRNTGAGLPMDCIGNGVVAQGVSIAGGNYYTMQVRLFIVNNALWCLGSGGAPPGLTLNQVPQVLAENIESMSFLFGIASPPVNSRTVQGYYSADDLNGVPANVAFAAQAVDARWAKVVAARVCVVVVSENAILSDVDANPTYLDCSDNAVAIADGRLRRAYSTTVLIRNHGVGFEN
jgi:type IV pilus assembly protein PilW